MSALSKQARETIRWWYLGDDPGIATTIAGYVRLHFPDGRWGGDTCGCPDDRCIGYHHDAGQVCQCLPTLLEDWVTEQRAAQEAEKIWAAYRAAGDGPGSQVLREAALAAAEAWVRRYHRQALSFSLDTVVGDRTGITITTRWNDRDHIVWTAAS